MNATVVKLLAAALVVASAVSALAEVRYVDVNSTNATPPYTNWTTAATNIQDAVDAAGAGDEVVVTNGTYAKGGRVTVGSTINRLAVDKPLNVRSVNGPQYTTISGARAISNTRCVYLTTGASLFGFTLTGGYADAGGGAYGGTLNNCTLTGNSAIRSAAQELYDAYGGGAAYSTLNNCTLTNNLAEGREGSFGGGAAYCTLNNCTLTRNSAFLNNTFGGTAYGGGAYYCTLNNCTLTGNSASDVFVVGVGVGGGTYGCSPNNCIIYFNTAYQWANYAAYQALSYCCTMPQPISGPGNLTNAPLFVDEANGDLRLQSNSPCINAGNNSYLTNATDLDGSPRVVGGTVDIGAYEYQTPASTISYAWLQEFNLPIDSFTDSSDPDGDGVDNYHEWLAGTNPTDALSSPAQLTITPSAAPPGGVILTWSTNAVGFALQSTTNLSPPGAWSTNSPAPVVISGQNVVTNPITGPRQFYRLSQ